VIRSVVDIKDPGEESARGYKGELAEEMATAIKN
jgi:hypothetical protein